MSRLGYGEIGYRCQSCHWMRDGLVTFRDAAGATWVLCQTCLPEVRAADLLVREAKKQADAARDREAAGQSTLFGPAPATGRRAQGSLEL